MHVYAAEFIQIHCSLREMAQSGYVDWHMQCSEHERQQQSAATAVLGLEPAVHACAVLWKCMHNAHRVCVLWNSSYASVGGSPEAYGGRCVCVSVCYSFARFSAQLLKTRRWKLQYMHNAVFSWISIDQIFDLKHCFLDTAWYAHLDTLLSAIQSSEKSKPSTTNFLSPW